MTQRSAHCETPADDWAYFMRAVFTAGMNVCDSWLTFSRYALLRIASPPAVSQCHTILAKTYIAVVIVLFDLFPQVLYLLAGSGLVDVGVKGVFHHYLVVTNDGPSAPSIFLVRYLTFSAVYAALVVLTILHNEKRTALPRHLKLHLRRLGIRAVCHTVVTGT